jgi:hypothetical protein
MREVLSVIMTLALLPRFAVAAPDTNTLTTQIGAMPLGTNIEVRLKTKQKLRGARGEVNRAGFTLVSAHAAEQQIAFDDVASVKLYVVKSHTMRNILIGVGIAAVALAITIAILLRCGPLGCHPTQSAVPISVHF